MQKGIRRQRGEMTALIVSMGSMKVKWLVFFTFWFLVTFWFFPASLCMPHVNRQNDQYLLPVGAAGDEMRTVKLEKNPAKDSPSLPKMGSKWTPSSSPQHQHQHPSLPWPGLVQGDPVDPGEVCTRAGRPDAERRPGAHLQGHTEVPGGQAGQGRVLGQDTVAAIVVRPKNCQKSAKFAVKLKKTFFPVSQTGLQPARLFNLVKVGGCCVQDKAQKQEGPGGEDRGDLGRHLGPQLPGQNLWGGLGQAAACGGRQGLVPQVQGEPGGQQRRGLEKNL